MSVMYDINDPEIVESMKYLLIPQAEKIRLTSQPFDGKKQWWLPDHKEGFIECELISQDKDKAEVKTCKGETMDVKFDDLQQMNPPKFERCEDMSDLTYLNDATVLHNLRQRYMNWMIYTYSGLFCVTINPYKRLPVYTMKLVYFYRGKKRNEVPPHLYYVADNAYACMTRDRENQSLLITGESGAGKTENTKKVIQYLAYVAASGVKPAEGGAKQASLEDQIVSANPVLEAYGNAKTTRNNNSSRFGKFIRIHFSAAGKIAGADIESYLLEKSRIVFQQPAERNYHIFYQLLAKEYPRYHDIMLVSADPSLYFFIAQGMLTIDNVDDAAEMKATDEAFDVLNFTQQEKDDLFKATACVCHWGNSKWKQRPREEQAETDGTEECEKVAQLLGIEAADLIKGLLTPRIKVGNDYVNKAQNKDQVVNSIGALCKSIYSRLFNWLVDRVNETLDVKTKRAYFIGVLDIAGFEIFDYNGFEQLCINYTNERLQQFFNHHMFVLEQEEYKKEGIQWEMMNFGLDLQACIDLIEKPLGILSILEEECIVPKATDKTFQEKLYTNHLGKHPNFGKPRPPKKGMKEAHFDLHHYAGTVSYSVDGWLDKNKDPINTTVATLFKFSKTNALISKLYQDMGEEEKAAAGGKKKGGSMQTISSNHREQLNKLMNTLRSTHPHFVRCIIPNEIKTGGILDAHLVMHQLHCNGVLEGIRICRKGFPNRLLYPEFKQRYSILAPAACGKGGFVDATKATGAILKEIALNEELYRLGNTKVFFKAGVLGQLEELRDAAVSNIVRMLQARVRAYIMKKTYKQMLSQRLSLAVLQSNIRAYLQFRNWGWWKLYTKIKPLLSASKREDELKAQQDEFNKIKEELEKESKLRKEFEEKSIKYLHEKNELNSQLELERVKVADLEEKLQALVLLKNELEEQLKQLKAKLAQEEQNVRDLQAKKKKLEADIDELKRRIDELQTALAKSEADNKRKDGEIRKLEEDVAQHEETNAKLTKEKKRLEEVNRSTQEQLSAEEAKVKQLNSVKSKLQQTLDEAEESLATEKRVRGDLDKARKKLDGELKAAQASLEELQRVKQDVESALSRKMNECQGLASKLETEKSQAIALQKKIKELQQVINEMRDQVDQEEQARAKAEKQRHDMARELDELRARLEEGGGGASSAALEASKRRESELNAECNRLRRDLEHARMQHEATVSHMQKRHQDTVTDLGEQIEQLRKMRAQLDKENHAMMASLREAALHTESVAKSKYAWRKNMNEQTNRMAEDITEIVDTLRNEEFTHANKLLGIVKILTRDSHLKFLVDESRSDILEKCQLNSRDTMIIFDRKFKEGLNETMRP